MTPRLKLGLIAAFAGVALLAVIGWSRKSGDAPANTYALPANTYATPVAGTYATPVAATTFDGDYVRTGYPAGSAGQFVPPSYMTRSTVRTVRPRVVEYRSTIVEERPVRVVKQRRHKRSTGKSVAIVAGSAGVGAAIGAIAGGGKGAGIGAIAGGAGGFVYDRLTHNRR